MEKQILFTLQFQIQQNSPFRFLERYWRVARADQQVFCLAQYLLELALLDSKMNQYKASLMASAALFVALRVCLSDSSSSSWTKALQEHTRYTSTQLKSCAQNYF